MSVAPIGAKESRAESMALVLPPLIASVAPTAIVTVIIVAHTRRGAREMADAATVPTEPKQPATTEHTRMSAGPMANPKAMSAPNIKEMALSAIRPEVGLRDPELCT